tara:strand:- start:130 stop:555 length:426 start_codon:yes stop_codon:yes gene_type:complete
MSREMELLRRLAEGDNRGDFFISNELLKEIEAILAQPESLREDLREGLREDLREGLREEPVAWCQMVEGKVQDLLTSFEMKGWLYDESWIPLYTAPPTREPFEPEERQRLSKAYSTRAEQVAFEEGIIFAEISYGIGVGNE